MPTLVLSLTRKLACHLLSAAFLVIPSALSQTPPPPAAPVAAANVVPANVSNWLTHDFPRLAMDRIVKHSNEHNLTYTDVYAVQRTSVSDCVLSINSETHTEQPPDTDHLMSTLITLTIPLGALDLSTLKVAESPTYGMTYSKPVLFVVVKALPGAGKPFGRQQEIVATKNKRPRLDLDSIGIQVPDHNVASLLMERLRAAAVGCGAPNVAPAAEPPKQANVAPPAESPKQAKGMTNDDVIAMVTAPLSDEVILNAIKQAPSTAFDVSPTALIALKKAKVSDSVIAAMQTAGTPKPDAVPPKPKQYDASLAEADRPVQPSDPCSGIESMGIYTNELMSPQMTQGGLYEWLAKIRNNTGVTKIIRFSWIDEYGQQKVAQIQLKGGDIATSRLDLTQKKFIPPVKDLKIVSCQ